MRRNAMILERDTSRRHFLVGTAAVGAPVLLADVFDGCGSPCTPGFVDSGLTAADLSVGDVRCPGSAPYFVARDAEGYYAYSSTCTHEQCTILCPGTTSPTATQGRTAGTSTCPCHGSVFDGTGHVLSGPAVRDLEHLSLSFAGTGPTARIMVDPCTTVADRSSRVAAP